MARIFISHSSRDNFEAVAFRDWLVSEGWASDDVFLDLHGIGAGARWKEALAKANERCEAVLFLVSPHSLASNECYVEIRMAEDMGKVILPTIVPPRVPEDRLAIEDPRLAIHRERQIVDASIEPREAVFTVEQAGQRRTITFHAPTLARIKARLDQLGISPDSFAWVPGSLGTASPYPGLTGFSQGEAALFFGRAGDIARGFASLRKLRRAALNRGHGGLLVIQAASGAGKSSFLKAGLWPRLIRDPDFTPIGILRPATGILTGDNGIGRQFSAYFARHNQPIPAANIHRALAGSASEAKITLLDFIAQATEIGRETQRLANPDAPPPSPIIAVDQAEELFAADDATESRRFLSLVAELIGPRGDPNAGTALPPPLFIWTIRADGMDALLQAATAHGFDTPELFALPPIARTSYTEIIHGPLAVANKAGMRLSIDPQLSQMLIDASEGADALPLLAYTLRQLVEDNRTGSRAHVSLEAFETGGGIGGVLQKRLAAAQRAVSASEQTVRALFVPRLATWDIDANQLGAKRLVADEMELFDGERKALRPLADALVAERLLTRGGDASGRTTLEVAHEAILRQSPIANWLEDAREFLIWRDRTQREQAAYEASARDLLIGRELDIARAWVEARGGDIPPNVKQFVEQSSTAEQARRHSEAERERLLRDAELAAARERQLAAEEVAAATKRTVRRTMAGLVTAVGLACLAAYAGLSAYQKQQEAESAKSSLALQQGQLRIAVDGYRLQLAAENDHRVGASLRAEKSGEDAVRIFRGLLGDAPNTVLWQRDLAASLTTVGDIQSSLRKFSVAIQTLSESLEIRRSLLNGDPANADLLHEVSSSSGKLGDVHFALGDYGEAVSNYHASVGALERANARSTLEAATGLDKLATAYREQGKFGEAEPNYARALEIRRFTLGDDHVDVSTSLNNLGLLHYSRGDYSQAESLLKQALAIRERILGPSHPDVAASLNNLATLYRVLGKYADAEGLQKRGFLVREAALGPEHPDVATSLSNLAALYRAEGRHAEEEPLLRRSLAIREKALGADHPDVGSSLNNLAELYALQERYDEADRLLKRALAIRERALGPGHPDVGSSLNAVAELYVMQKRYEEAEPLLKRSLEIREKALGEVHPDVASSLHSLGELYRVQGRHSEAERLLDRSLTLRETALGSHPDVGKSLNSLAWLALQQSQYARAAEHWRRANGLAAFRPDRGAQRQNPRSTFAGFVKSMHRLAPEGQRDARETFEVAQWMQDSDVSGSLAQMATRSANDSPELGSLVRERQDLSAEWQALDKQLIAAMSQPPSRRDPGSEKSRADRLVTLRKRLDEIDLRLAKDFPEHAALSRSKPASIAEVQSLLGENEALISFLDTVEFRPLPEETFIWVVTKRHVRWLRSEMGSDGLRREVEALRCGLEQSHWFSPGSRCAELTGSTFTEADRAASKPLPFDLARAHLLYRSLLGEAAEMLKGKHLLMVPSGALTQLPLHVLVAKPPATAELDKAAWLISEHAVTVLPSVSSLMGLRRTARPSRATEPMIGFGNPLLDGQGGFYTTLAMKARALTGCSSAQAGSAVPAESAPAPGPAPVALPAGKLGGSQDQGQPPAAGQGSQESVSPPAGASRGLADISHLRMQPPLPETAEELCDVARSIGADLKEIRLGRHATEAEVKRLSQTGHLARFRILHFSTHGVAAGAISGVSEAGLILTPPATATEEDDGYLSSSEIANLRLDASLVIVSGHVTPELVRAFFYAGARSLLIAYWDLDSQAAVSLITGAARELAKGGGIVAAEATRRAMLSVMVDQSRPSSWGSAFHPSIWAPLVVLGDAGVVRTGEPVAPSPALGPLGPSLLR